MGRGLVLILGSVIVLAVVALARGRSAASPGVPTVGFLVRRIWTALVRRPGAAARVPYDSAAIARSPTITWIGHSAFLVRMDGATFLTDPMFSDRAGPLPFIGPPRLVPPGLPLAALPKVDFALLSHDHYDHADLWSVQQLARRGIRFVVARGLGEWIKRAGGEAIELDWWQSVALDGVRITCVPAQHFSGRSLWDRNRRLWAGGEAIELDWWQSVALDGVRITCVPAQHFSGRSLWDRNRRLWAGWVVAGPTRRFYH